MLQRKWRNSYQLSTRLKAANKIMQKLEELLHFAILQSEYRAVPRLAIFLLCDIRLFSMIEFLFLLRSSSLRALRQYERPSPCYYSRCCNARLFMKITTTFPPIQKALPVFLSTLLALRSSYYCDTLCQKHTRTHSLPLSHLPTQKPFYLT